MSIDDLTPAPEDGFYWNHAPWGPVLRCAALDPFADHFFSARGLEPLSLHRPHPVAFEPPPAVGLVAAYLEARPDHVWRLRQVHGAEVVTAAGAWGATPDEEWPAADAVVTARPDLVLTVRTADCAPVLMVDPRREVVAAVHAGWRGLATGVIPAAIAWMRAHFGVRPADVLAAIGPSIGPARYEVREDVRQAFRDAGHDDAACARWFRARADRRGAYWLDVWQASRDALIAAGLPPARIHAAGLCTATHVSLFHSHRVEGARAGRMISAIRFNRILHDAA